MAVQLTISYETLVELIEQLSEAEQKAPVERLLSGRQAAALTRAERLASYHASIMSIPLREEPSIRREDWHDDDAGKASCGRSTLAVASPTRHIKMNENDSRMVEGERS